MSVKDFKKEDIKELKKDGYICITTDINGNVNGIYKTATEAESTGEYDIIVL